MVDNYGDSVQDRAIPNPIRTFGEAYDDFRESRVFDLLNITRRQKLMFIVIILGHMNTVRTEMYSRTGLKSHCNSKLSVTAVKHSHQPFLMITLRLQFSSTLRSRKAAHCMSILLVFPSLSYILSLVITYSTLSFFMSFTAEIMDEIHKAGFEKPSPIQVHL